MRPAAGAALAVVACAMAVAPFQAGRDPHGVITLASLVGSADPLHQHDLRFDARFAAAAAEHLARPQDADVPGLAALPATAHLLDHAQQFDYDVPHDSPRALVNALLARIPAPSPTLDASIAFFTGPLLDDPHWIDDPLRYLPPAFRFHGSLFLVAGYDIGVALAPNASLNGAHAHFTGHARELRYYAIHELHHVGFMTYTAPPRIASLRTCADLADLVEYSTALEGSAVVAALDRRRLDGAVADDADYVALGDDETMRREEALFFEDYDLLVRRGREPADAAAWAVIERMSSGSRRWYRVGARMILRVEKRDGRPALVERLARNPRSLVSTAR